jgi:hypothetical protein
MLWEDFDDFVLQLAAPSKDPEPLAGPGGGQQYQRLALHPQPQPALHADQLEAERVHADSTV